MENIFTGAKPFLFLAKVLGLFPMEFEGPTRKGFLKFKLSNLLSTCCAVALLLCLTSANTFYLVVIPKTQFLSQSWNISVSLENFSFVVLYGYQVFKRENIVKFLKKLQAIDEV